MSAVRFNRTADVFVVDNMVIRIVLKIMYVETDLWKEKQENHTGKL